jgi:hypothetical protein
MTFVSFLNVYIRKGGIPSVLLEWYTVFQVLTTHKTTQEIIFVSDLSLRKFMAEPKKSFHDLL